MEADNEDAFMVEAEAEAHVDASTPLLAQAHTQQPQHGKQEDEDWPGGEDFKHLPWWKRPSILWLLPPSLLFTIAFGGIIAPKLNLIKNLICRDYLARQASMNPSFQYLPIQFDMGNDQCRIPAVQAGATQFNLIGGVLAGILSAITSPKLGSLSDRYGRTRILIVPTLGAFTGELITIYAASHPETFAVKWLYLGFILDGLCGSFTTGMALSYAFAADCVAPSRRNVAFGYFHGTLFTGIALGPLLAGLLIKATGTLLSVFWFAFGCHIFFLFCLVFIIPESLSKTRQYAAREKDSINHVTANLSSDDESVPRSVQKYSAQLLGQIVKLYEPLKVLWPVGPGTSPALRRNLVLLSAVDTVMFGVAMGAMTVVLYYTDYQFKWTTPDQSFFMSIVNCCRVLGLLVILPLVTRLVRGPLKARKNQGHHGCDNLDLYVIRTAAFFDALGYLGYALARTGPLFILSGCLASIGGIGSPSLQAALTKHVPHEQVGQLLGANGLLHAIAKMVAPIIFNGIYIATVGTFPQTVFACLCAAFFAAFALSWGLRKGIYWHEPGS